MTTGPQSQCYACRHLRGGDLDAPETCDAFPAGIPDEVYDGVLDHRQPVDGDRGVRWAPRTPETTFPEFTIAPAVAT